ncbi:MAG: BolA family transcriptional regulator [Paludibacterium sp.]|uniref:BolA family protein n=1 Tax=Paludibacterium sp. TaxID=1917523 RepID=UPI0025E18AED|nr:BolA family protein [Paludibacterium sp.]MBV8048857.1 BolA family transcriptional regulator [Paludibacterium sp.]MBV8646486.1 BolA family transcriptional regulator [Paludibacterium sp.]
MSDTLAQMEQRLAALAPSRLDIRDDSQLHAGHAGARAGGGHYHLTITSTQFSGLSRVARHRLVYQTLGDLMQTRIHALAIDALAPDES